MASLESYQSHWHSNIWFHQWLTDTNHKSKAWAVIWDLGLGLDWATLLKWLQKKYIPCKLPNANHFSYVHVLDCFFPKEHPSYWGLEQIIITCHRHFFWILASPKPKGCVRVTTLLPKNSVLHYVLLISIPNFLCWQMEETRPREAKCLTQITGDSFNFPGIHPSSCATDTLYYSILMAAVPSRVRLFNFCNLLQ